MIKKSALQTLCRA